MTAKAINATKSPLEDGHRAHSVIVPLDGTSVATVAVPVARAIAAIESSELYIIHVGETIRLPYHKVEELGLDQRSFSGAILEQHIGDPAENILNVVHEKQASIIVMCTHTSSQKSAGELGSVACEVICRSPCPVVLVQPGRDYASWKLKRALFPHDGSPLSAMGIGHAAHLAHRAGAELMVLHVGVKCGSDVAAEPGTLAAPRYVDQLHHEMPSWAEEFLTRLEAVGHPPSAVKLRLFMAVGEPSDEIVRFARMHDVNVIVLTWRGCWEPEHAKTLRNILRNAECPVLTLRVPHPD